MKIALVTCVWKRPNVLHLFCENTKHLISQIEDFDVQVFAVGSEGWISKRTVKDFGFNYMEYHNLPLHNKWNKAVEFASNWNPDYYLLMGSDDIMDLQMFNNYVPHMEQGVDFIGSMDWYFYEMNKRQAIHWKGYQEHWRMGQTCGAGRMISKRLMKMLNFQPWKHKKHHGGMDAAMQRNLAPLKYTERVITCGGGIGVDLKTSDNITKFAMWDNCQPVNKNKITSRFINLQ
jgi:hypothetical protein